MSPSAQQIHESNWTDSGRVALPALVSTLIGLALLALAPRGLSGWEPWRALPMLICGLSNAAQLPAMHLAGRALQWHGDYETYALNRRIAAVLRWTIPASIAAMSLLLVRHAEELFETPFGQHLLFFWLGQLLLVSRRRSDLPELAFQHRRTEIVYLVFGLGLLTSLHAVAVAHTPLGRDLCLGFALLLFCRAVLQVTVYRKVWPTELSPHSIALLLLFTAQSAMYGAHAIGIVGR